MSVELEWLMRLRIVETVVDAFVDTAQDTLRRDGAGETRELDSATVPDVDDYAMFLLTLSAGAGSINLAALPHNHGGATITKDATGKKIRAWAFWTPSANANNIVIVNGASNGYIPVGTAFRKEIVPDGESGDYFKGAAAAVGASTRVLDVTGTGAQQVYCAIAWGD